MPIFALIKTLKGIKINMHIFETASVMALTLTYIQGLNTAFKIFQTYPKAEERECYMERHCTKHTTILTRLFFYLRKPRTLATSEANIGNAQTGTQNQPRPHEPACCIDSGAKERRERESGAALNRWDGGKTRRPHYRQALPHSLGEPRGRRPDAGRAAG